ncbi:DUF779 domain-containing protein [Streptosporangium sp. NPDC002721]|uniref:DUF779 domain-containing protein n=1 Tax=Streptosporangium sp. NPDC002721 TaxID=3366188 RepID=UPI0036AC9676
MAKRGSVAVVPGHVPSFDRVRSFFDRVQAPNGTADRIERLRRCPPRPHARRVDLTDAAADLLRRLHERYGRLMFHQPRGCPDGSAPMCYRATDFRPGDADVHLGDLTVDGIGEPIPVWMPASHFEYWKHTHITIDAVPGRGRGLSLETGEGVRFLIRSRLLSDRELGELDGGRPVPALSGEASDHRKAGTPWKRGRTGLDRA